MDRLLRYYEIESFTFTTFGKILNHGNATFLSGQDSEISANAKGLHTPIKFDSVSNESGFDSEKLISTA